MHGIAATTHGPSLNPRPGEAPAPLRRAAAELEAVFLGQLLGALTQGIGGDGALGGGDDPFSAMMRDEYAKLLGRGSRIGIADAVLRQLLRAQEAA
jgi:peptidoglycan hydrolase FlgJ